MLCWARFREQSCLGRSARWPVLLSVMRPDRRLRTPGDCDDHTTPDTPAGRRRRSPPRMPAKTGPLRESRLQRLRRLFHHPRLLHRRRLRQGLRRPCRRCSRWNESSRNESFRGVAPATRANLGRFAIRHALSPPRFRRPTILSRDQTSTSWPSTSRLAASSACSSLSASMGLYEWTLLSVSIR